jgi:hypothetical protein
MPADYSTHQAFGIANQIACAERHNALNTAVGNTTERRLLAKLNEEQATEVCSSLRR